MFRMIDFKRLSPATAVAAVVLAAIAFGSLVSPAGADERGRERDHRDNHRGAWNGGYYRAPPVVYSQPYYAPPLVYGPGLSINIR